LQADLDNIINQIIIFMNIIKKNLVLFFIVLFLVSCSSSKDNKNTFVLMKTTLGEITLRLYDDTPGHRDNFIKLVKCHVYEGISFHRVIKDFMIQAGDPETKINYKKVSNDSLSTYTIPAEFNLKYFHKKGALAAAREGNDVNPEMRSSGTQFYIVQGTKYSDAELNQAEQRINNNLKQVLFLKMIKEVSDSNRISGTNLNEAQIQEKTSLRMFQTLATKGDYKIPEEQRDTYKNIGGVPRLDRTYTVFGEVVDGLDVVDRIASVKTNESDKPLTDIRIIKMKIIHK
jgi:cyclophilin family peptidyl-prolyl cis-trans isomerase